MKENPQHEYKTYNVSFTNDKPKRTPETIEWADVIVIPSDSEFRYHGELQMNPKDLAKSESHMEKIRPYFEGKDVIMFRSDRGDTEELYRSFLPNIRNFTTIDEVDFPGNIHGMKYHFIQTLKNPLADMIGTTKDTLFSYWGRMKTGHDREKTIRQIYRDKDISTTLIGGMPSGIKRKSSWIKDWRQLYPLLETSRCTLCFNWIDNTATTSRYIEALAVGMIPFVWRDYDINNQSRKSPGKTFAGDLVNQNTRGQAQPPYSPRNTPNQMSRLMNIVLDTGTLPAGKSSEKELETWRNNPDQQNSDSANSAIQSIMRYNQLFTIQTTITIPGDFSIRAGDTVKCSFPQLDSDKNSGKNPQTKGIYMVAHVRHKITPENTLTSLSLVRDSYGK